MSLVENHKCLGDYRILLVEESGRLWVSQGYHIFNSDDYGTHFQKRATYVVSFPHKVLERFHLARRAIRSGFANLLVAANGTLVASIRGAILRCDTNSNYFKPVLSKPHRSFKIEQSPDGMFFAGEYFYNTSRESVYIYASSDQGQTWEVVYTFPPGTIRHVHNIWYDKKHRRLLILTGDLDHESKVLFTNDQFRTLKVLAEGSQRTRAAVILPHMEGFYLPTDTPMEQNYIQLLDESGKIHPLLPIEGSCLAACRVKNCVFFGTAAEPSPVNLNPCSTLYGSADGQHWEAVARWRADRWSRGPSWLAAIFQMGRVLLPRGKNLTNYLFATTIAVDDADGILHRWQVQSV
jgi:hypothetical protein